MQREREREREKDGVCVRERCCEDTGVCVVGGGGGGRRMRNREGK